MKAPPLRFPPPLRPGDRIAVTAPSSGVPASLHRRLEIVLGHLRAQGFVVEEGGCMRDEQAGASAPAAARAGELMRFLLRDDVAAVFPPWGGELAIELLDRLDWAALGTDARGAAAAGLQRFHPGAEQPLAAPVDRLRRGARHHLPAHRAHPLAVARRPRGRDDARAPGRGLHRRAAAPGRHALRRRAGLRAGLGRRWCGLVPRELRARPRGVGAGAAPAALVRLAWTSAMCRPADAIRQRIG